MYRKIREAIVNSREARPLLTPARPPGSGASPSGPRCFVGALRGTMTAGNIELDRAVRRVDLDSDRDRSSG